MILPADRSAWPEDALSAFEERVAIMLEGNVDWPESRALAEAERSTREWFLTIEEKANG